MRILFIFIFLSFCTTHAAVLIQQRVDKNGRVVSIESIRHFKKIISKKMIVKDIQEFIGEKTSVPSQIRFQEIWIPDSEVQSVLMKSTVQNNYEDNRMTGSEVRTLVAQGPVENRIDLTFVGDGYTEIEKEKFFLDVERMTRDLFEGQTFASYLPLFNVHAVFVPSQESGLTDIYRKNTALGLYRDPVGSKRAIMPGNTGAIERAIALAPDTDYPILIANDDFYGGLGGRYAITTRSEESGTVVLRHELGHNFGNVGEEYDGGYVYSGANFSSYGNNPSWSHWLSGPLEVYESQFLAGEYVWKNLAQGSFKSQFQFPGTGYIFDLIISSVGWATKEDVSVRLDGQDKEIEGTYTADRSFFKFKNPENLSRGTHSLEFLENVNDGDNVLAFAMAYAHPENINRDPGHVASYSTFDSSGRKRGYRPTFDTCLMRDMKSVNFCVVDQENMWIRFLNVVSLIDDISLNSERQINILTPSLDGLEIHWFTKEYGSDYKWASSQSKTFDARDPKIQKVKAVVEFKTFEVQKPGVSFRAEKEISL